MSKKRSISKIFLIGLIISLTAFTTSVFLFGCGSSESDPVLTGIFVDSAVQGLEYQYGNKIGKTDENGRFYYHDKKSIVFSLGGVEIGRTAEPKELMTPIDLVDDETSFVTHQTVTNICRLLQSLDVDGDPENGISITKEIRDIIQSTGKTTFNFNSDPDAFKLAINPLFDELNNAGIFTGGQIPRALVDPISAQNHLFSTLAQENATPVVMINLGDGYTNGTQGGFGNVHQYTQVASFAAYISYQLENACDLIWENPLLEVDNDQFNEDGTRIFYRIENDEDDFDSEEDYVSYFVPTNLGVDGATVYSLINEKTDLASGAYGLINELMLPIPEEGYNNIDVSQLNAASYVAGLYPGRLKLFTLWIGAQDTLGAVTDDRSNHLTKDEILAYLNDAAMGRENIEDNLATIINTLKRIDNGRVFIGTLPSTKTIGALYGKSDIEAMANFNGADVTALSNGELIGYNALIDKDGTIGTSIAGALDTDNATLNAAISKTILNDANFLNTEEIAIIDDKIDEINSLIHSFEDDNVAVVDLESLIFDKLTNEGIEILNATGTTSYRVYKTFAMDKGFYNPDGFYPSYTGSAIIANAFLNAINTAQNENSEEKIGIGILTDVYDEIVDTVLSVDSYNTDADEDGFVISPGVMGTLFTITQYDEDQIGGWIDCNDDDADVLPSFVSDGDCD